MATMKCVYILLATLTSMFLYCYLATRISDTLVRIGYAVHQSHWYNYPTETQKCLVLMLRQSQIPIKFNGLKIFDCDLRVFATVKTNKTVNFDTLKIFKFYCRYCGWFNLFT